MGSNIRCASNQVPFAEGSPDHDPELKPRRYPMAVRGKTLKILVFLHGTVIMHSSAVGVPREQRVRQSSTHEPSVREFASYVPVGDAVSKLHNWARQGAEVVYLSSHRRAEDVRKDEAVLRRYGFPEGPVLQRGSDDSYADVAERALPDVLVEDDCESIGGANEMVYPHLQDPISRRIHSIAVPEFGGIDHLPSDLAELSRF